MLSKSVILVQNTAHYHFPIARNQSYRHLNITVVMVVGNVAVAENDYSTALSSVRCYCKMHDYEFLLIDDYKYRNKCTQEDVSPVSKRLQPFSIFSLCSVATASSQNFSSKLIG